MPASTELPEPPEGWIRFGCMTCGNVRMLPSHGDGDVPWCVHHDGNYSWRPPRPNQVIAWTRMVPVKVLRKV